jgi:hypothetical protein
MAGSSAATIRRIADNVSPSPASVRTTKESAAGSDTSVSCGPAVTMGKYTVSLGGCSRPS